MGETSGQVARAWHRRRRDQRLGYSALGLGAGGFVLVLAGTLLVTEVVPNLLDDEPAPAQRVVPASELQPVPAGPDGRGVPQGPPAVVSVGTVVPDPATQPATQPATGQTEPGQTDADGPDSGGPAPDPQPDPPAGQGPVSALLDPVVQGVTGTVDGASGGATTPVTAPVTGLVDGVTDVVDGLLDLQ
ncbi:MAG: hypothetical protein F2693_09165 [Actinobacteria bacterium]|nr:hypothetical protein [Actinomycetota bacterium]